MLNGKSLLLVITGGIAAYKCLELIRRLQDRGATVRVVMTESAKQFVTPMSVAALSNNPVFDNLFDLKDEAEMGHIRLSREADMVLVAPATADFLAKMANGLANDLASTVMLATDKPVLVAPAMNPFMWQHAATQRNIKTLKADGIRFIGPVAGDMACGEVGAGRMVEPHDILQALEAFAAEQDKANARPLAGKKAIVTSGPTREAIDPVRYISNHSSGKQGHAIAAALAKLGADVTLVTGPVSIPAPDGVSPVKIETARDMLAACEAALPADIAVCAAAVADWRIDSEATSKIKKQPGEGPPALCMVENPDILKTISQHASQRPALVVGFAAETDDVQDNASAKRQRKGCDWIVANDVSAENGIFGGDNNTVHLHDQSGIEDWPTMDKIAVAARLADRIAAHFNKD